MKAIMIGGPHDGSIHDLYGSRPLVGSFISLGHVSNRGTERSWYYIEKRNSGKDPIPYHYNAEKSHVIVNHMPIIWIGETMPDPDATD